MRGHDHGTGQDLPYDARMSELMDLLAGLVILVCVPTIVLILTIWGTSVLHRGLAGKLWLIGGRTQKRLLKPVDWRLVALGAVSISLAWLITSGIAFAFAPDRTPMWIAWAGALGGTLTMTPAMLAWAVAGRRRRRRWRCPQCWRDSSTVDGLACPGCGLTAEADAMRPKPRKPKLGYALVGIPPLITALLILIPMMSDRYSWRSAIPTNVIISGLDTMSDSVLGLHEDLWWDQRQGRPAAAGSLVDRLDKGSLSARQFDALANRLDELASSARDPHQLMRVLTLATVANHRITIDPGEAGFVRWVARAIEPSCTGEIYFLSEYWHENVTIVVPSSLGWSERQELIERLLIAAVTSLTEWSHNETRLVTACALAGDDIALLERIVDQAGAVFLADVRDREGVSKTPQLLIDPRTLTMSAPITVSAIVWSRWIEATSIDERSAWSWVLYLMTPGIEPDEGTIIEFQGPNRTLPRPVSRQREKVIVDQLLSDIASHPYLLSRRYSPEARSVDGLRFLMVMLLYRSIVVEATPVDSLDDPNALKRAVALATIRLPRGQWFYDFDALLVLAAHDHPPLRAAAAWSIKEICEFRDYDFVSAHIRRVMELPDYPELTAIKKFATDWLGVDNNELGGEGSDGAAVDAHP